MVGAAFGQGISSRNVKPQLRGKPSGRPFLARLTDVAKQAGLAQPIIYGGVDSKSYIIEVVGCGVAFIDYDNHGWMDLLVLSGTRLEGRPVRPIGCTRTTATERLPMSPRKPGCSAAVGHRP